MRTNFMLTNFTKTLLISTFLFSITNVAQATELKPYMKATAQYVFSNTEESDDGVDFIDNHYKTGAGGTFGIGAKYDSFRVEGEALYLSTNIDGFQTSAGASGRLDTDVKVAAFMANGYIDINTGTALTPYVGAGLGVAHATFSTAGIDDASDDVLAYQALAGVSYNIDPHNSISLGYRYFATNDLSIGGSTTTFGKSIAEIGYRYTF